MVLDKITKDKKYLDLLLSLYSKAVMELVAIGATYSESSSILIECAEDIIDRNLIKIGEYTQHWQMNRLDLDTCELGEGDLAYSIPLGQHPLTFWESRIYGLYRKYDPEYGETPDYCNYFPMDLYLAIHCIHSVDPEKYIKKHFKNYVKTS